MTDFPHDNIKPFSAGEGKKQQVSRMFDAIAGRYDFMNRFLSVGIDVGWRKKAIALFKKSKPQHMLDVATGTADMAIMAAKILAPKKNNRHRHIRKNAGNRAAESGKAEPGNDY